MASSSEDKLKKEKAVETSTMKANQHLNSYTKAMGNVYNQLLELFDGDGQAAKRAFEELLSKNEQAVRQAIKESK